MKITVPLKHTRESLYSPCHIREQDKYLDKMKKLVSNISARASTIPYRRSKSGKYYFQRIPVLDIKQEMIKAGYSPSTAREPIKILERSSFKEMLASKISNEEVLDVQRGNLKAKTLYPVKVDNTFTKEQAVELGEELGGKFSMFSPPTKHGKQAFFLIPYYKIRDISLDKLYKLAGVYATEKLEVTARPLEGMSDDELANKIAEAKKRFSKD